MSFRKTERDAIALELIGSLCKHSFTSLLFPHEWKDSWLSPLQSRPPSTHLFIIILWV